LGSPIVYSRSSEKLNVYLNSWNTIPVYESIRKFGGVYVLINGSEVSEVWQCIVGFSYQTQILQKSVPEHRTPPPPHFLNVRPCACMKILMLDENLLDGNTTPLTKC
jgi:hypothetical protein